jgi:hypothetical protein
MEAGHVGRISHRRALRFKADHSGTEMLQAHERTLPCAAKCGANAETAALLPGLHWRGPAIALLGPAVRCKRRGRSGRDLLQDLAEQFRQTIAAFHDLLFHDLRVGTVVVCPPRDGIVHLLSLGIVNHDRLGDQDLPLRVPTRGDRHPTLQGGCKGGHVHGARGPLDQVVIPVAVEVTMRVPIDEQEVRSVVTLESMVFDVKRCRRNQDGLARAVRMNIALAPACALNPGKAAA